VKVAQNKHACTSTKIWVHGSADDMEEGELEEPFDAPWDEHVGPESIATAYVHGTETAHAAARARGGVWSSNMTKQAKSIFANNICGAAMLRFREDIRGSQPVFALAQTCNNDMQASMLDPAETLEGFWAAQDILRKAGIKAKREVTRRQYESETWVGPMHAWRDGQEEVYAEIIQV